MQKDVKLEPNAPIRPIRRKDILKINVTFYESSGTKVTAALVVVLGILNMCAWLSANQTP